MSIEKLNQIRLDLKTNLTYLEIARKNATNEKVVFAVESQDRFFISGKQLLDQVLIEKLTLITKDMTSDSVYKILRD